MAAYDLRHDAGIAITYVTPPLGGHLVELSENAPRIIALIDLPDLRWQVKRIDRGFEDDLTAFVAQLEAGVAKLNPAPKGRLWLTAVYVYSPLEADRPREVGRLIFRRRTTETKSKCGGCYGACTHCQEGAMDLGGRGSDNSIADDLLELAREDRYDWAVIVSTDPRLIPVIRYLQSHGRKIIHGCFPPVAMDLTNESWASIDLRPFIGEPE